MKKIRSSEPLRPWILGALGLSVPAFYLILAGPDENYRKVGSVLYGCMAACMAIGLWRAAAGRLSWLWRHPMRMDGAIMLGAAASAWPTSFPWSFAEWALRLAFCALIFFRLLMFFTGWIAPHRLAQTLFAAIVLWAMAGAGFYWLDPSISRYEDGLWLAFTTGATVGYGDLVPSTAASRIFAVFMVLLGYALFSVVTASIAALFVGEDEKRIEKELHADIRLLRKEVAALRNELGSLKEPVERSDDVRDGTEK